MSNPFPYPKEFHLSELTELFKRIIQGHCVSLVGVGTVGKTHLVEHFSENTEAQEHILLNLKVSDIKPNDLLFVHVDPNGMIDLGPLNAHFPPAWPGFDLIFRGIMHTVQHVQGNESESQDSLYRLISERWKASIDTTRHGPIMVFPLIELSVNNIFDEILRKHGNKDGRLIIVLDDFHTLLEKMPRSFFLNLRALRNQHRYRLVYIVVGRQDIHELIEPSQRADLEDFTDLFQEPIYISAAMNSYDMEVVFAYLEHRIHGENGIWSDDAKQLMFHVSSGHGGLMRTCFAFYELFHKDKDKDNLVRKLVLQPSIVKECQIILESCIPEEKSMLKRVAQGVTLNLGSYEDARLLKGLSQKQLVIEENNVYRIASPLLAFYVFGLERGFYDIKNDSV